MTLTNKGQGVVKDNLRIKFWVNNAQIMLGNQEDISVSDFLLLLKTKTDINFPSLCGGKVFEKKVFQSRLWTVCIALLTMAFLMGVLNLVLWILFKRDYSTLCETHANHKETDSNSIMSHSSFNKLK